MEKNEQFKKKFGGLVHDEISFLRQGIAIQRENYKQANIQQDTESMIRALENIKAEITSKAIAKGNIKKIERIQKIFNWYHKLPMQHTRMTENGPVTQYPPNIEIQINRNLRVAYELLIDQLNNLGLI